MLDHPWLTFICAIGILAILFFVIEYFKHRRLLCYEQGKLQQLEAELKRNEDRFRVTFEKAGVGIAYTDLDGRYFRANDLCCEMVGYSRDEMMNMTFRQITLPADLAAEHEAMQSLMNGDLDQWTIEKRIVRKDFTVRWVALTLSLVRDAEDKPRYFIRVVHDISKRKFAEEAQRDAEGKYRSIFDTAVESIIVIDEMGCIKAFNRAAEMAFGYVANEVIGRNLKILMPDPYQTEHADYLENYRTTGVRKVIGMAREVPGKRKNGDIFPIELTVSEWWSNGARYFTGVCRDITERKKMSEVNKIADSPVDGAPHGTERVLLVEDVMEVRALGQEVLMMLGYNVVAVADAASAMALFKQNQTFDLLFTDIVMPGELNGIALAQAAREIQPSIKVLYTSGFAQALTDEKEFKTFAANFIRKPYRIDELARAVRSVLGNEEVPVRKVADKQESVL